MLAITLYLVSYIVNDKYGQKNFNTRLGCFDVTAILSWGWLKLSLIEVEIDWDWGWLKLRLIEVEVDWSRG